MTSTSASANSASIAEIKQRYRNSMPDKASELTRLIATLSGVDMSAANLQETHAYLHRLAGSSGMYGYDELSQCCQSTIVFIQHQRQAETIAGLQSLLELLEQYA